MKHEEEIELSKFSIWSIIIKICLFFGKIAQNTCLE